MTTPASPAGPLPLLTAIRWIIRVGFLLLLLLGIAIWTGAAHHLTIIHIVIGILFVLALLILAGVVGSSGRMPGLAVGIAIVAIAIAVLGLTQERIDPGSTHWIVSVCHLLLGAIGMGLAEMAGARTARRLAGA